MWVLISYYLRSKIAIEHHQETLATIEPNTSPTMQCFPITWGQTIYITELPYAS